VSRPLSKRVLLATFFRSFLIQGGWNYRSMLGSGFLFCMLPVLRSLRDEDGEFRESLRLHSEHFNAHPYLASIALGSVTRMEADGVDPQEIQRFKTAVRGPLGGLGDALVWAAWLPAASLAGLIAVWGWGSPLLGACVFLAVYNVGHVGLRVWGFSLGLREGPRVGQRLQAAGLPLWTERVRSGGVLLLGVAVGLILARPGGLGAAGGAWVGVGAGTFAIGLLGGHRFWRPTAVVVVGFVCVITLIGWVV